MEPIEQGWSRQGGGGVKTIPGKDMEPIEQGWSQAGGGGVKTIPGKDMYLIEQGRGTIPGKDMEPIETFLGGVQRTGAGSKPRISRVVSKSDRDHVSATMAHRTLGLTPAGTICHSNLCLGLYPIQRAGVKPGRGGG